MKLKKVDLAGEQPVGQSVKDIGNHAGEKSGKRAVKGPQDIDPVVLFASPFRKIFRSLRYER